MIHRTITLSALLALGAAASAQQTPTTQTPSNQTPVTQTPPIAPRVVETPLPPPVVLPPPVTPTPDVPDRPLTADEAARIALNRQPNVMVAEAGVQAAGGRTQTARAGLRPSVGIDAGYSHTESLSGGTTGAFGASSGYQASAGVRQLLFDFNNTRERVRQAGAEERAAGYNLTRVQADTVLRVKQAFYSYVQETRLVEANEANLANRRAQLALARARLESGLGLPSDVVRAETGVAEATLGLQVARNNAAIARIDLAEQMGVDPRTPITAADSREPAPATEDVEALVQQAVAQRPEMRQSGAALEAARHGVRAARTDNAPSIGANLGVSTRGNGLPPANSGLSVGASLVWDLYDAGATAGRVRQAEAEIRASEADLEAARLRVTADVSAAYLNLKTAEQRVVTATAQVANAEEGVRLAEGRYRAGLGTFLEVTDTQSELLAARVNRVNAETAVDIARAALARATGAGVL